MYSKYALNLFNRINNIPKKVATGTSLFRQYNFSCKKLPPAISRSAALLLFTPGTVPYCLQPGKRTRALRYRHVPIKRKYGWISYGIQSPKCIQRKRSGRDRQKRSPPDREKRYDNDLIASGIPKDHIYKLGIAFDGKDVCIRTSL